MQSIQRSTFPVFTHRGFTRILMNSSNSIALGMWIGTAVGIGTEKSIEKSWEEVTNRINANLSKANLRIAELASFRDAYKSLATELVLELKEIKPRRLSVPFADDARLAHLELTLSEAQEKYKLAQEKERADWAHEARLKANRERAKRW